MKRFFPLFLLLATAAVYAPAVWNDFVWDDRALVLQDPLIRSWRLIPEAFEHFLFTDASASDFYRPIQRLSYTLDYAAFGFGPAGYHITSIACHFLAAAALFLLGLELFKMLGLADRKSCVLSLLAALVWAIHPVQSSAVVYVSGRADPLAAAFGFCGLYFGLRSLRANGARVWLFLNGAALLFLLSGLSKEIGLIFPALWLTILALQRNWKATARAAVATAFVLVIYLSLRMPFEHIVPPPASTTPALVRPIIAARAVAEYAGLLALPINLRMERDVHSHPSGFGNESMTGAAWRELQTIAGILLIGAFCYWLARERKHDPATSLCLSLAAISYLPVSGLITLNASVAEHWLYLPSAFFFLAVACAGARLWESVSFHRSLRPLLPFAIASWVVFLGGRTFLRTFDWKDQRTFLENTIASGGDSPRMLINLGSLEASEGHLKAAKQHLQAALQKEPDAPLAVINLAAVAVKEGDGKAAHELLDRAKEMPLVAAQAYEMLTVLEHKETGYANLLRMRLAARTGPPNWAIERRYVQLLDEAGSPDAAATELRHCLTTQWYRADSWQLLGEILAKAGRGPEAQAARIQAERYDVHLAGRGDRL